MYQLGILGNPSSIPALQQALDNDSNADLRNVARAAISHIQNTSQMSKSDDANADVEWTRQFVQYVEKSANFMAFDVSDLAQQISDEALKILRSSGITTPTADPMSGIVSDSSSPTSPSGGSIAGMLSGLANEISKGQRSPGGILGSMLSSSLGLPTRSAGQSSQNQPQKPEIQFEMLWDCEFCGAEKLLGITHRHCPNCGAAQNPAARYFPKPGEEIALEDHRFVGVDVICPACDSPNSATAKFCGNCGADVETGERASLRSARMITEGLGENKRDLVKEKFEAEQARIHANAKTQARKESFVGRNRGKLIGGSVISSIGLIGAFIFGFFFMRIHENVTITNHTWERSYQIQEYQRVRDTSDCSAVPRGADITNRRTETRQVRSCERVCEQQQVDQGDGSGRTENVCHDECQNVPQEVQVCTYEVNRWVNIDADWAALSGNNLSPEWPDSGDILSCNNTPDRLGEQCLKDRDEKYILHFVRENGDDVQCDLDNIDEWQSFEDGAEVRVAFTYFSRLRDKALCDTLEVVD
jgi:hypothetical protein